MLFCTHTSLPLHVDRHCQIIHPHWSWMAWCLELAISQRKGPDAWILHGEGESELRCWLTLPLSWMVRDWRAWWCCEIQSFSSLAPDVLWHPKSKHMGLIQEHCHLGNMSFSFWFILEVSIWSQPHCKAGVTMAGCRLFQPHDPGMLGGHWSMSTPNTFF